MIDGGRNFFSGVFPHWNPYQYGGSPSAGIGVYALTYPLTYFSYFIATFIFQNEFLTIEVFTILHLMLGFFTMFYLLHHILSLHLIPSSLGALCWALAGFNLIIGRSWYYMNPTIFWFPLLIIFMLNLQNLRKSWSWVIALSLSLGLYFHAGNVQMWVYSCIFLGVFFILIWFAQKLTKKDLLYLIPVSLIALSIILPLLYVQLNELQGIDRNVGPSDGIWHSLKSLFLPYPLSKDSHPLPLGSIDHETISSYYYSGTTLAILGCVGTILYLVRPKNYLNFSFAILTILTFIFCLGPDGYLWTWLHQLPMLNKFQEPAKFLPFFNFFMLVTGSVFLHEMILKIKKPHAKNIFVAAIFIVTLSFVFYLVAIARASLYSYHNKTYETLDPGFEKHLREKPVRILGFAPERTIAPNYSQSLKHQFPTFFKVFAPFGYDPLVSALSESHKIITTFHSDPNLAADIYGISFFIISPLVENPILSPNPTRHYAERNLLEHTRRELLTQLKEKSSLVLKNELGYELWKTSSSQPLVFLDHPEKNPLRFSVNGQGIKIQLPSQINSPIDIKIIVNFLWRKNFKAFANDHKIVSLEKDHWDRMLITIPRDAKWIELRYAPPWGKGFLLGLICLIVGLLSYRFLRLIWTIK